MKNTMEDIIDLTDVVSVGNGVDTSANEIAGGFDGTFAEEKAVLDSLVNDFEENSSNPGGSELDDLDDGALDLSNLDNLISSYNLDFSEGNAAEAENTAEEIPFEQFEQTDSAENGSLDNDFDAIFNDIKNEIEDNEDFVAREVISETYSENLQDNLENNNTEIDEIDLLTQDIVDGVQQPVTAMQKSQVYTQNMACSKNEADSKSESQENEWDLFDKEFQQAEDKVSLSQHQPAPVLDHADTLFEDIHPEENLKSDMAQDNDLEQISDEAFSNILNELSVEHENDEDVVSFAEEAGTESTPIHLHGDVNFLETGKTENLEDINLVQSASKILDSDEAYLEKFNDEDDSLNAKVKKLFIGIASLEQRVNASDSKWQDSGLALNYRLSGLESKLAALEENAMNEISQLKSTLSNFSESVKEIVANNQGLISSEQNELLFQKLQDLETRVANLDDIFAEQKMLNDELAKSFEENAGHAEELNQTVSQENQKNAEYIQALESKIALLEEQVSYANSKIEQFSEFAETMNYKMEELHSELEIFHGKILEFDNIESAASLAAAKVIREEIIPLLNGEE